MDEVIPYKVVLVGETGVGKTSIISKLIYDKFCPSLDPTPGANFSTKGITIEEFQKTIKFEIWDTAGQEQYRSLAKVFYKNSPICILVYDITRRETFEELKNYWINEIKQIDLPNFSKSIYIYCF